MLDRLKPRARSTHRPKRVGRGPGSGLNKTSGRGTKGQGHRSAGRETPLYFEGGQMPLVRRIPKRGFKNIFRKEVEIVNVGDLARFGDGATVDAATLAEAGITRSARGPVKLLGEGDAPRNLTIKLQRVSAGARRKVEEAGGSVEVVS